MKNPLYRSKSPGPSVSMCQVPARGCYRHRVGHSRRWAGATRRPPARPRPRPTVAVRGRSSAVGGLRAREARPRWRRKSFRLAGWRECAIVAARFSSRSRARAVEVLRLRGVFLFFLLQFLGFCRVGEFGLGFVPDEKSKACFKCTCLLAFFLSVICCCETRRPFEEDWSTVVSVLDWY